MSALVPTPEQIRALAPEEKESLKKDYFRKIHEDFPGLDYPMISAAIDQFLAEPESTPDDILRSYNPDIWKRSEEDTKKVEAAMATLPETGKLVRDPVLLELMNKNLQNAPENAGKQWKKPVDEPDEVGQTLIYE